ncbi:DNA (cytosine-5-)-methyltransferase N-terminal subunit [Mycoplasmopsis bovis]|uniref:DNA (cytosine-5-)-methyltransferase N-terminal subunit n=1 Tax=Mycoplasmopsis bovis TaxID=28903 RepID=UPI003BF710E9
MKNIKIYELFAGIGSQLKACKNIANSLEANFVSLGACEWFIDAIIGYMKIHYGSVLSENELSRNEMADILSKFTFSADSKQAVGSAYFTRMNEQKLCKIFPYLYGFVNYEYFNKKWENRKIIRGGARVLLIYKYQRYFNTSQKHWHSNLFLSLPRYLTTR